MDWGEWITKHTLDEIKEKWGLKMEIVVQTEKEKKTPRLIDANEILKSEHQHYDYMADEYYVLVRDIENAPTVDAIEVVWCKNCKHNQLPPTSGNAECELWYGMTDVYGYCHYGERREDE